MHASAKDSGDTRDGSFTCPAAKAHPFFKTLGAQTTIQRWFADDVLNNNKIDRTLRTVFTHDHYGPSSHQQTGLYAGLVIEPTGLLERPETRDDGHTGAGWSTSWQAVILETDPSLSHREFLFEFALQLAYEAGTGVDANGRPIPDPNGVINPPVRTVCHSSWKTPICPGGVPLPCPEAISAADPGTMSVNYRNEPVHCACAIQTRTPGKAVPLVTCRKSTSRISGAPIRTSTFSRRSTLRADEVYIPAIHSHCFCIRKRQSSIRIPVGAQEETHNLTINGHKWLHQPGTPQDPTANNQYMGYRTASSRHIRTLRVSDGQGNRYSAIVRSSITSTRTALSDGQWNGVWGIFRVTTAVGSAGRFAVVAQQPGGRCQLSTNDSSFTTDPAFPTGVTDYKDSTDGSVTTDTTITTDTSLMSSDMIATTTATTTGTMTETTTTT